MIPEKIDLLFIPRGGLYRNESLEEAVKRVLSEETGLQPINITQISTMTHLWPETHTVTTYYKVEVNSDKIN